MVEGEGKETGKPKLWMTTVESIFPGWEKKTLDVSWSSNSLLGRNGQVHIWNRLYFGLICILNKTHPSKYAEVI